MFFQFGYVCYIDYGIWIIFVVWIGKGLYYDVFIDGGRVKIVSFWEINNIDFLFVFECKFVDFFIDGDVWEVVYFLLQAG